MVVVRGCSASLYHGTVTVFYDYNTELSRSQLKEKMILYCDTNNIKV